MTNPTFSGRTGKRPVCSHWRLFLQSLVVLGGFVGFASCGVAVDLDELQSDCQLDTEFCCPAGEKLCDGQCVGRRNPRYGCGADACTPCFVDHATATCGTNGACDIAVCDSGFADCDGLGANGCEVDLSSDRNNCRHCGLQCEFPNGGGSCVDSRCQLDRCAVGWLDCSPGGLTTRISLGGGLGTENVPNGEDCESPVDSNEHCGSCLNQCAEDEQCELDGVDNQGRLSFSCH